MLQASTTDPLTGLRNRRYLFEQIDKDVDLVMRHYRDGTETLKPGGNNDLLFLMVVFLIVGMFMDTPVALTLLVPLFAPQALAQDINPVHLGILLCFNLCIGLITPPMGGCLMVVVVM